MKTNFRLATLEKDLRFIEENEGSITKERLIYLYDRYMHGSDMYLLATDYDGKAYGRYYKTLPPYYCKVMTESKDKNQYLRFRPESQEDKAKFCKNKNVICFAEDESILHEYNKNWGRGFEAVVYDSFGRLDEYDPDDKIPSWVQGDIRIDNIEVQLKYCHRHSGATITTTKKIKNRLRQLIAEHKAA